MASFGLDTYTSVGSPSTRAGKSKRRRQMAACLTETMSAAAQQKDSLRRSDQKLGNIGVSGGVNNPDQKPGDVEGDVEANNTNSYCNVAKTDGANTNSNNGGHVNAGGNDNSNTNGNTNISGLGRYTTSASAATSQPSFSGSISNASTPGSVVGGTTSASTKKNKCPILVNDALIVKSATGGNVSLFPPGGGGTGILNTGASNTNSNANHTNTTPKSGRTTTNANTHTCSISLPVGNNLNNLTPKTAAHKLCPLTPPLTTNGSASNAHSVSGRAGGAGPLFDANPFGGGLVGGGGGGGGSGAGGGPGVAGGLKRATHPFGQSVITPRRSSEGGGRPTPKGGNGRTNTKSNTMASHGHVGALLSPIKTASMEGSSSSSSSSSNQSSNVITSEGSSSHHHNEWARSVTTLRDAPSNNNPKTTPPMAQRTPLSSRGESSSQDFEGKQAEFEIEQNTGSSGSYLPGSNDRDGNSMVGCFSFGRHDADQLSNIMGNKNSFPGDNNNRRAEIYERNVIDNDNETIDNGNVIQNEDTVGTHDSTFLRRPELTSRGSVGDISQASGLSVFSADPLMELPLRNSGSRSSNTFPEPPSTTGSSGPSSEVVGLGSARGAARNALRIRGLDKLSRGGDDPNNSRLSSRRSSRRNSSEIVLKSLDGGVVGGGYYYGNTNTNSNTNTTTIVGNTATTSDGIVDDPESLNSRPNSIAQSAVAISHNNAAGKNSMSTKSNNSPSENNTNVMKNNFFTNDVGGAVTSAIPSQNDSIQTKLPPGTSPLKNHRQHFAVSSGTPNNATTAVAHNNNHNNHGTSNSSNNTHSNITTTGAASPTPGGAAAATENFISGKRTSSKHKTCGRSKSQAKKQSLSGGNPNIRIPSGGTIPANNPNSTEKPGDVGFSAADLENSGWRKELPTIKRDRASEKSSSSSSQSSGVVAAESSEGGSGILIPSSNQSIISSSNGRGKRGTMSNGPPPVAAAATDGEGNFRSVSQATDEESQSLRQEVRKLQQKMEDMVVQNVELKRSVQILQEGIVESMTGNKSRFMGSSAAAKKSKMSGAGVGGGAGGNLVLDGGGVKLPILQDLDELKEILNRKKNTIADLEALLEQKEAELDERIREDGARNARHAQEIFRWDDRWNTMMKKYEIMTTRVRDSDNNWYSVQ